MRSGRRFKFVCFRVQRTPILKTPFRTAVKPPSSIPASNTLDPLEACTNRTQREIISILLRSPRDWSPISRHDILDPRTQAAITPAALDQALHRLAHLGIIEARGSGDLREVRVVLPRK